MLHDAVIVAYGRSPVCRALKGALSQIHPVDYAAETLLFSLKRVRLKNTSFIKALTTKLFWGEDIRNSGE